MTAETTAPPQAPEDLSDEQLEGELRRRNEEKARKLEAEKEAARERLKALVLAALEGVDLPPGALVEVRSIGGKTEVAVREARLTGETGRRGIPVHYPRAVGRTFTFKLSGSVNHVEVLDPSGRLRHKETGKEYPSPTSLLRELKPGETSALTILKDSVTGESLQSYSDRRPKQ